MQQAPSLSQEVSRVRIDEEAQEDHEYEKNPDSARNSGASSVAPLVSFNKNESVRTLDTRDSKASGRGTRHSVFSAMKDYGAKAGRASLAVGRHSLFAPQPQWGPVKSKDTSASDMLNYCDPLAEAETAIDILQAQAYIQKSETQESTVPPSMGASESVRTVVDHPTRESQTPKLDKAHATQLLNTWADMEMEPELTQQCRNHDGCTGQGTVNFDDLVSAKKRMDAQREQKQGRFLIRPGSRCLTVWRTSMVLVVLWAVMMAPFEMAFDWWTPSPAFGVMSYSVDIFCIMDMLLNFITARIVHGRVVTNHSEIASAYLRSWFVIDFLTNFPWDKAMAQKGGKGRKVMKILKLPKVVRLTRLLRVAREEAHTFGTFFTLAGLLLLAHYYSCLWVVLLIDCDSEAEECPPVLDAYGQGLSVGMAILGGNDGWMRFSLERSLSSGDISYNGFQWKAGFGIDLASVFTCLGGFCAMGMLFANIARAMDRQDSHSRKFNERLANVKAAKNQYGMEHELYMRARGHFHYVWSCGSDASRALLEDHTLSPDLRRELSHSFYGDLLRKVPFLAMAEDHLVKQLCGYARMEVFSPHDKIIMAGESGTELFFLVSGAVEVQKPDDGTTLRRLDEGSFFGEMALFKPESRRTVNVVGKSFGWLLVVSLVVLRELCSGELMAAFKAVALERNQVVPEQLREELQDDFEGSDDELDNYETLRANTNANATANRFSKESMMSHLSLNPQLNGKAGLHSKMPVSPVKPSQPASQGLSGIPEPTNKAEGGQHEKPQQQKGRNSLDSIGSTSSKGVQFLTGGSSPGQQAEEAKVESSRKDNQLSSSWEGRRGIASQPVPSNLDSSKTDHEGSGTCNTSLPKLGQTLGQTLITLERLELKIDNLATRMDRRMSHLEERVGGHQGARFTLDTFKNNYRSFGHQLTPGSSRGASMLSTGLHSVPASPRGSTLGTKSPPPGADSTRASHRKNGSTRPSPRPSGQLMEELIGLQNASESSSAQIVPHSEPPPSNPPTAVNEEFAKKLDVLAAELKLPSEAGSSPLGGGQPDARNKLGREEASFEAFEEESRQGQQGASHLNKDELPPLPNSTNDAHP